MQNLIILTISKVLIKVELANNLFLSHILPTFRQGPPGKKASKYQPTQVKNQPTQLRVDLKSKSPSTNHSTRKPLSAE